MSVLRLDDAWEPALDELLLRAPATNLFLLGYADAIPLRRAWWYGVRHGDRLRAVCLVVPGRLIVPFAPLDPRDATALGNHLRRRHPPAMMVGPRAACDALWEAFAPDAPLDRHYDQRLYQCTQPGPRHPVPGFRKAALDDLDVIAEQARHMEHEDLGRWPDADDPDAWRRGMRRRIERGQTWVIERSGEIVFQIHVGTVTAWGAQVGGTWVPPEHRGRGLATEGMAGLSRALLPGHRMLTLHVNEANTPAVRVYEKAGYVADAPFRLLTVAGDG